MNCELVFVQIIGEPKEPSLLVNVQEISVEFMKVNLAISKSVRKTFIELFLAKKNNKVPRFNQS